MLVDIQILADRATDVWGIGSSPAVGELCNSTFFKINSQQFNLQTSFKVVSPCK
jgi:hypothetical protein